ncbi:MAG: methyl-accepting chemotaxis protein [Peptostreptococcales bacterium]
MKKISQKVMAVITAATILSSVLIGVMCIYKIQEQSSKNYEAYKEALYNDYDELVKSQVNNAISVINLYHTQYQAGELSLEEAQKRAADGVRAMRYNESGYFWLDTVDGMGIANVDRSLEGTDRTNTQDVHGFYTVKESSRLALAGGGYMDYAWPKLGETVENASPKRSYSGLFEPWQWVVGTGNYIDDINAIALSFEEENSKSTQALVHVLILTVCGVLALSIIIAYVFGKKLAAPIVALKETLRKIAGTGNLDIEVQVNTKDEVHDLSLEFQSLIDTMKKQAGYAEKIADGDLSIEIEARSEEDVLAKNMNEVVETLRQLIQETDSLTRAATEGRFNVRAAHEQFTGGYKDILQGINNTLEVIVEKVLWYEAILDYTPVPVSVTDMDMNWTFINKAAEKLSSLKREDVLGKHCSNWKGSVCGTDRCGIECLKRDEKESSFEQMGRYFKISPSYLLNAKGEKIGHIEIIEDETGRIKAKNYIKSEVDRLAKNLELLAGGNLALDYDVAKGDKYTVVEKEAFLQINENLETAMESIQGYVQEISDVLLEMANSNFDIAIKNEYLGDFRQIKESLNTVLESFNSILREIHESAEQVEIGAEQVAASSQNLSQGAAEQAAAVEQIGATAIQISDQTKENANNANRANELSIKAKTDAQNGNIQMEGMLEAMNAIKEASKSISNIIKVIDEIAFQTNILALNAAVEAARAGDHGKGFAVVAEEVRNLAARSATAAKETTSLIDNSIDKVEEGYRIANQTAEALNNIVVGAADTVEIVGKIAAASVEQADSISEISRGIEQVSQVTQINTATAEESASASEQMAGQAQMLKELITQFKIKRDSKDSYIREVAASKDLPENKDKRKKEAEIPLEKYDFGKY